MRSLAPGRLLVYGIYAYTGRLVGELAVHRGLDLVVAGRNREQTSLAARVLGVESRTFALNDPDVLDEALRDVDVVAHCAGPYERTAELMVAACLRTGTHYLDLAGEANVFEAIYRHDGEAHAAGVALVPGVGFDVVPTDHLVAVAESAPMGRFETP